MGQLCLEYREAQLSRNPGINQPADPVWAARNAKYDAFAQLVNQPPGSNLLPGNIQGFAERYCPKPRF